MASLSGQQNRNFITCDAVLVSRQFAVSQYSVCDVMTW